MTGPVLTGTNTDEMVMTRKQAQEFLKISDRQMDKLIKEDKLPMFLVGKRARFYLHDLLNLPRAKK